MGTVLMLATGIRNRFLREQTLLGTIPFSNGGGSLADPVEIWAGPAPDDVRWEDELIVLTDALTYSASEDFVLGLQGLPHGTVVGRRSGGGSGRPRTIRITDEMSLTVSTALTFGRHGVCIGNYGISVDIECEVFTGDGRNVALERVRAQAWICFLASGYFIRTRLSLVDGLLDVRTGVRRAARSPGHSGHVSLCWRRAR